LIARADRFQPAPPSRAWFGRAGLLQDRGMSAGCTALRQARGELPRFHPVQASAPHWRVRAL